MSSQGRMWIACTRAVEYNMANPPTPEQSLPRHKLIRWASTQHTQQHLQHIWVTGILTFDKFHCHQHIIHFCKWNNCNIFGKFNNPWKYLKQFHFLINSFSVFLCFIMIFFLFYFTSIFLFFCFNNNTHTHTLTHSASCHAYIRHTIKTHSPSFHIHIQQSNSILHPSGIPNVQV